MDKSSLIFLFMLAFILSACGDTIFFRQDKILANGWPSNDKINFNIGDTIISKSNVYIHLRNNYEYPFSNVFLIINLRKNQKLLESDTVEYIMADPSGKWLGSGFGEVIDNRLWWKENWLPEEADSLLVEIYQANRINGREKAEENLAGVLSVGLSIEPVE
jgi:gliding motility-associated lipoprotein GldH